MTAQLYKDVSGEEIPVIIDDDLALDNYPSFKDKKIVSLLIGFGENLIVLTVTHDLNADKLIEHVSSQKGNLEKAGIAIVEGNVAE